MKKLNFRNMPELSFEVTEALNQLRVNLGFCGDEIKTIMITSSMPNEGKSFLTVQLWKMMAEVGIPTLLIDCDFRNSELRSKYGIGSTEKIVSCAHYLAGKAELQDVIYETNIPNGFMIPVTSSIANPTILLERQRFGQMVKECAQAFGYVLIDTPPLGSVADALNIATHCDGTVLVVRSGETPRKMVDNSVQLLRRTETPLLGIVLNRADMTNKSNVYYRKYYRSNYYYKNYGYGMQSRKGKEIREVRDSKEIREPGGIRRETRSSAADEAAVTRSGESGKSPISLLGKKEEESAPAGKTAGTK